MIVREVAPPVVRPNAPLQMLVTNIDYDEHKGRIAIGRVTGGTIKKAQQVRMHYCWVSGRGGGVQGGRGLFTALVLQLKGLRRQLVHGLVNLLALVTNTDYDEHKGGIAIGCVTGGTINKAQQVNICCGRKGLGRGDRGLRVIGVGGQDGVTAGSCSADNTAQAAAGGSATVVGWLAVAAVALAAVAATALPTLTQVVG